MRIRLFTFIIGAISLATVGQASIIFRPGEKVKYVAPGEEEVSGNAQRLNDIAQEAEKKETMAAPSRPMLYSCGNIPTIRWHQPQPTGRPS